MTLRNKFSIFIYIVIALAIVGVVSSLFTNPIKFISNILLMLVVGAVIFALVYFFVIKRRLPSNEMKKYKQAVRQSKQKYKQHTSVSTKTPHQKKHSLTKIRTKTKKRPDHLRVIDGNKSKRKKRDSI
ncbi:hypothetical protein DX933_11310 [Ornithinibacillus gellani]|nr:hypothetical protein DX933_11310 [Ornithinibacillus gellani]